MRFLVMFASKSHRGRAPHVLSIVDHHVFEENLMRLTVFLSALFASAFLCTTGSAQVPGHDGPYTYSWNHAHNHTCSEYSEYPWTRCQASESHRIAVENPRMRHGCESPDCAGGCVHGHCSPQHLYRRNCDMIRGMRDDYCIPRATVDDLCRRNDAAYSTCRMYPKGTCLQCAPPPGYGCRPTLEQVNVQLESLKTKCFVHTHK
jgi:hypothetical protein